MAWNTEYPYIDPNRTNIDWAINQVKEFGKTLDSWESTINQLLEALQELDGWEDRIQILETATADLPEIRQHLTDLDNSIVDLYNANSATNRCIDMITINYELVLEELAALQALQKVYLDLANEYTDAKLRSFYIEYKAKVYELEEAIEELRQLRPEILINPVRGTTNNLQRSYDLAYNDMREDALTVAQFAELGLTVNQFNALGLNALWFGLHSRSVFKWDYVTAPISKLYKPIAQAIGEVVEFVLGSFTVDEFAALDLTCDQFAALDYTCIDFLAANDSNRGLTAGEFVDIIKSSGSNLLRI